MLRNLYTYACAMFALLFLVGFQSQSHASRVLSSGQITAADNSYIALYISGNTATNSGQVSITTGSAHYYGFITGLTVSATSIQASASSTAFGSTTVVNETLTRPDTSSSWTVTYTVTVDGILVTSYSALLRGTVNILP